MGGKGGGRKGRREEREVGGKGGGRKGRRQEREEGGEKRKREVGDGREGMWEDSVPSLCTVAFAASEATESSAGREKLVSLCYHSTVLTLEHTGGKVLRGSS